jgi:flagellum-specific ATP synthase
MKAHPFIRKIEQADLCPAFGFVKKVAPGVIEASGPAAALGDLCEIECTSNARTGSVKILAEVTAVDTRRIVLVPLEQQISVALEAKVTGRRTGDRVPVGDNYAGRAVDAMGRPIDAGGEIDAEEYLSLHGEVPRPLDRADPRRILTTGIRAIDGVLTLAQGQRVGVFSASGVGKTSLMEQLASQVACDRCVLCLVGERGREVESIWRKLHSRDDAHKFTLVAATSDQSASLRSRCASYALSLADYWRSKGEHVVVMIDSVTRVAMALREIGLAAGSPPTVRAYTPNIFFALPQLVERCGALASGGSITAIMTVLSETDDIDDPIVELMKSLLDGHIILSRSLAEQGHFPAIDIPRSVSRGAERLVASDHAAAMRACVSLLASYEEARVMIESGVYKSGTNPNVDKAITTRPALLDFLRQPTSECTPLDAAINRLRSLIDRVPHSG